VFIEDLSTNGYFVHGANVRAIGWLEVGHPFTRGPMPGDVLAVLKNHVVKAHQVVCFMGFHECSLCPEGRQRTGLDNLVVPTRERLYVAPGLVVHYIEDHGYRPPYEFLVAVQTCPEQGSVEFLDLLRPFEHVWRDPA
jgi:hypothetical protein